MAKKTNFLEDPQNNACVPQKGRRKETVSNIGYVTRLPALLDLTFFVMTFYLQTVPSVTQY